MMTEEETKRRSSPGAESCRPPAPRRLAASQPANADAAQTQPSTFNIQHPTDSGIALLTGGGDKPYALGLASALTSERISIDFVGSDDLDEPVLRDNPRVRFLNLRGDQSTEAGRMAKVLRVFRYYLRLLLYAATAKPKIFHILWNNKFELIDRTLLLLYYRLLGKRLVFTAHNVNAGKRDGNDSWLNRLTLRAQYRLVDNIFVHTDAMKRELMSGFNVPDSKVTVIPFGINNTLPNSGVTKAQARQQLGIGTGEKTVLFFGNIAPYKGLEYLAEAMTKLIGQDRSYRLVIAGKTKGCEEYWGRIRHGMDRAGILDRVIEKIEYIPDQDVELYFKSADLLVLPYTHIFQSGVLFLGYSFGLPVIASDVGSLSEEIMEGKTGFVFKAKDPADLTGTLQKYFVSDLYERLETNRGLIREYANDRYSWSRVGEITRKVYEELLAD